MKIGLYRQGAGTGLGGGEMCIALLAEALSRKHEVELVHHNRLLTIESVFELFAIQLDNVAIRYVHPIDKSGVGIWARWRKARKMTKRLSHGYDLFVNFTHTIPPRCYARRGILHVMFPLEEWPWATCGNGPGVRMVKEHLARLVRRCRHAEALRSYDKHTANSRYTRDWTQRRWGTSCSVHYPPVWESFLPSPKADQIATIGRFTPQKSQLHLMSAYRGLEELHRSGWTFVCAGHLGIKQKDRDYFDSVRTAAEGLPCKIQVDLARSQIHELYRTTKLFWLGSGFTEDENRHPERVEHFGVATVEAMAAGAVPLLIDKGAAREIIEHGVTGFLWRTLAELQDYSTLLARDDALRETMAGAARQRAADFSLARFLDGFS